MLLRGPRKHGYATELWTLQRVAEVIERNFGVRYDPSGVWHVLRRMGWSCQKPERRARERDEQAIAAWRKKEWPRIKKRPKKRPFIPEDITTLGHALADSLRKTRGQQLLLRSFFKHARLPL